MWGGIYLVDCNSTCGSGVIANCCGGSGVNKMDLRF